MSPIGLLLTCVYRLLPMKHYLRRWLCIASLGALAAQGLIAAPFDPLSQACRARGGSLHSCGTQQPSTPARFADANSDWIAFGGAGGGCEGGIAVIRRLANGNMIVGGNFLSCSGVPANGVAIWNGSTWSPIGSGASNGVNGTVLAIAEIGADLFVGGTFSQAGGVAARNIAKWDGTAWAPLGPANGQGVNGTVYSIANDGGSVIAAGQFNQAGSQYASNIARWIGAAWSPLESSGTGVQGTIRAVLVSEGSIYVGGYFQSAGGVSARHVARSGRSTQLSPRRAIDATLFCFVPRPPRGGPAAQTDASREGVLLTPRAPMKRGDAARLDVRVGQR